jgi:hypothetical protein
LPTAATKETAIDGPDSSDDGGCSIGRAHSGSSADLLAWCVALGAALGFSRRVRRQR